MKTEIYNQCNLVKGNVHQVSYIPKKYAKLGSFVKLKDKDGQWEDGWKVTTVGTDTPEDQIPDVHDGIKAHRRSTGDSLPK